MTTPTTSEPTIAIALETLPEQPCVQIPVQASLSEWSKATDQVEVVFAWLGTHRVAPAGPLFFRYFRGGSLTDPFSLAVGIATATAAASAGPVEAATIPAGEYVTAVHHGHPDQIAAVHTAIMQWVVEQGRHVALDTAGAMIGAFEFYQSDPEVHPDPGTWETTVAYLLDPAPR